MMSTTAVPMWRGSTPACEEIGRHAAQMVLDLAQIARTSSSTTETALRSK